MKPTGRIAIGFTIILLMVIASYAFGGSRERMTSNGVLSEPVSGTAATSDTSLVVGSSTGAGGCRVRFNPNSCLFENLSGGGTLTVNGSTTASGSVVSGADVEVATGRATYFNGGTHTVSISYDGSNLNLGQNAPVIIPNGLNMSGAGTFLAFVHNLMVPTAPTISSGFGTSPSVTAHNGTATFRINVGTGGVATSGVIGLPAAFAGWNCFCNDITTKSATVASCQQTASSTTTATIGNFTTAEAAGAWVASDIVAVSCMAY